MSHDIILTDDDGVRWSRDNLSTNAWLRGHFPGAEAFHQKLLERARRLFDDGKYDEAKTLRELSIAVLKELQPELDRAVAQHKQNYPTQISDEEPWPMQPHMIVILRLADGSTVQVHPRNCPCHGCRLPVMRPREVRSPVRTA